MSDIMLYDSQTTFQGGMQSGFDPGHVSEDQYFRGINLSCRDGVIGCRPSFDRKNLDISNLDSVEVIATQTGYYNDAVDVLEARQGLVTSKEGEITAQEGVIDDAETAYEGSWTNGDNQISSMNLLAYAVEFISRAFVRTDGLIDYLENYGELLYYDGGNSVYEQAIGWTAKDGYDQTDVDNLKAAFDVYRSNLIATVATKAIREGCAAFVDSTPGVTTTGKRLHEVAHPYTLTGSIDNAPIVYLDDYYVTIPAASHGMPLSYADLMKVIIKGTTNYDGRHDYDFNSTNTFDLYSSHTAETPSGATWYYQDAEMGRRLDLVAEFDTLETYIAAETVYYDAWQDEIAALQALNDELPALEASVTDQQVIVDHYTEVLDLLFDSETVFSEGKFQGAEIYNTRSRSYIVTVISGHVFIINLESGYVSCLTTYLTQLNEYIDRCYFAQAENYMIVQDGISLPKILEGASLREADQSVPEIPTGTNMAYGHGRIAVQVSPRHFKMGDIFLAYEPENVLKMRETKYLNEGGGFTVSGRLGNIVSLQYANVSDTSTGDGPLLAICENGFSTFAVNNPRNQWMNIAMQKVQLLGTGIVGKDASCNINEDILYRSQEGIRSYAVGRQEAAGAHKYTELSREMEPYIVADKSHNSRMLSMEFFDKRMLALTASRGIKAKSSNYAVAELAYDEAKDAAVLLDPDVTDENARQKYLLQLNAVYEATTTWTERAGVDASWVTQQIIDTEAANEEDKDAYIEALYAKATSDVAEAQTNLLDALRVYSDAIDALQAEIVDDTYFKGIISFDFSLAGYTKSTSESQYKRVTSGSYDGIWTGINATQILTSMVDGIKRCFVMAKCCNGENVIYEVTNKITGRDNNISPIECIVETRAMPYKAEQTYVPAPFVNKKIEDINLWLAGIEDEVPVSVYASSDVINAYTKVGDLSMKALTRSADTPSSIGAPQSRAMISLLDMEDLYDETTKHPIRNGNEFQFRIIWEGKMILRRFFTAARKIADETTVRNTIDATKVQYPIDTFDQYRYNIEA